MSEFFEKIITFIVVAVTFVAANIFVLIGAVFNIALSIVILPFALLFGAYVRNKQKEEQKRNETGDQGQDLNQYCNNELGKHMDHGLSVLDHFKIGNLMRQKEQKRKEQEALDEAW